MLLYLHIPFCDSKCNYCAFCSYTDKNELKPLFMKSILEQLKFELQRFKVEKKSITSLFVGGGTPSSVSSNLYEPFIKTILPYLHENAELTTEANPNSATFEWLQNMKIFGFNRVSFGVQSFDEKKLKFLGRNHCKNDAIFAVQNAQKSGYENISIDLMYGTKKDTKKLLLNDINLAANLNINHISAYSLTIEEKTPFYNKKEVAKDSLNLAKFVVKTLHEGGFMQYEISSFGKNYECFHNKDYWRLKPYIGVGCGAVGFDGKMRIYPSKDLKKYINNPLLHEEEFLNQKELVLEKIFLGFRSNIGVDISLLEPKKTLLLINKKKLLLQENYVYNTNYFLADELALYLGK